MTSTFSWLDYSERDRRTMLDVIRLFQEKDTRDELGIGNIRDAFADLLFPGTSTIQTRARYLLFVPWMYQQLEAQGIRSANIAAVARQYEVSLIDALMGTPDTDGVIGSQARSGLKRLPSSIYWQGLGRLGIRLFTGSQEQYHRSLDAFYDGRRRQKASVEEGERVDVVVPGNWHAGLPSAPHGFPKHASFTLSPAEASYLRERIMSSAYGSLLAILVDRGSKPVAIDAPWQHPEYAAFPQVIQNQLDHARVFAEVIHGAALLYNLLLAEQTKHTKGEEWRATYLASLATWASELEQRRAAFTTWKRDEFWEIIDHQQINVGFSTRCFVNEWFDLSLTPKGADTIATNKEARTLIHNRERILKRSLARLDNPRALELYTGAAGTNPLRYRWATASQFIADIYNGLGTTHA